MANPLYDVGDVVYLRESAALGRLEAVTITGIHRYGSDWIYSHAARIGSPTHAVIYGDRRSFVHGQLLYLSESELITHCEALTIAEANMQRQLAALQTQIASVCETGTDGTA